MEWQRPEFIEFDMNAEIGAYQRDTGDGSDPDRIERARTELPTAAAEPATVPRA